MEMEPVRNCQTPSMRETEVGSWANWCWAQGKADNWNNVNGQEEEWWTMLGNAYPSWIQVRQLPSGWKHPSLMRPPGGVSKDPGHYCPPHLDEYNWQSPLPPNNWYYPFPKWLPRIIFFFFFFVINSQTKGLIMSVGHLVLSSCWYSFRFLWCIPPRPKLSASNNKELSVMWSPLREKVESLSPHQYKWSFNF